MTWLVQWLLSAPPPPVPDVPTVGETIDSSIGLATGAGGISLLGLLGWFGTIVNRAFRLTIPRLADAHAKAVEKLAEEHKEALASISEKLEMAIKDQRVADREDQRLARGDFREALKEDRAELRASLDKLTEAVKYLEQTIRNTQRTP